MDFPVLAEKKFGSPNINGSADGIGASAMWEIPNAIFTLIVFWKGI